MASDASDNVRLAQYLKEALLKRCETIWQHAYRNLPRFSNAFCILILEVLYNSSIANKLRVFQNGITRYFSGVRHVRNTDGEEIDGSKVNICDRKVRLCSVNKALVISPCAPLP